MNNMKRTYQKPAMRVVTLQSCSMLAQSGAVKSTDGFPSPAPIWGTPGPYDR